MCVELVECSARSVTHQRVVYDNHTRCRRCHVTFCGAGAEGQETIGVNFGMNIGDRAGSRKRGDMSAVSAQMWLSGITTVDKEYIDYCIAVYYNSKIRIEKQ